MHERRPILELVSRNDAQFELALRGLRTLSAVRATLDRVERRLVGAARADGRSWADIAEALGVAKQTAWSRHRGVDERPLGDSPRPFG